MHKALLRRWCDAMLKYQLYDTGDTRLDGGLLCPACMRVHGRSADAILPLVTQWQTDGDERCLHAAEKLFAWSANMRRPDGSMNNDTNSNWNGITVFYANALGETLLCVFVTAGCASKNVHGFPLCLRSDFVGEFKQSSVVQFLVLLLVVLVLR